MSNNFVIFEDQENLSAPTAFVEAKRDRQKLAPLTLKAINKENSTENQVRKVVCRFFFILFTLEILCSSQTACEVAKAFGFFVDHREWSI